MANGAGDRGAADIPASRADARRNRARVLDAARTAFAAEGRMVPLGEIARRAGVGAGTVYRHFPSKEALFEAVIVESVEACVREARELTGSSAPGEAFFRFLEQMVERAAFDRALCDALAEAARHAGRAPDHAADAQREFGIALRELLVRAQRAGAVRGDVDVAHVHTLLVGCAAMEQRGERVGRPPGLLTAVVFDGLRTDGTVTKFRNEKERAGAVTRNETPCCETCGAPLPAPRTGRPARYCGAACRQKAHRERRRRAHA
ncbi:TetR/AcrR family transcriptional regulator [Streptomyces sp. NPDC048172]|uniref:TetR/AcrR family transcriptional regulator n=1 Tax=Streptomyces sp. NPDC048172 TaxID=3365505 RepID=UPI00371B04BC